MLILGIQIWICVTVESGNTINPKSLKPLHPDPVTLPSSQEDLSQKLILKIR